MWLAAAAGRPCRNLDPYLSDTAEYAGTFRRHAATADLAIVEGNKGLYDGLALDGSNSNAAVAKALQLPVILVVDARGMTRGIAPLILGYQAFDRDVRIAGVILNNLGGSRHEAKLRAVIEHYTDVRVLGAIHCDARLAIVERHLGLVPSNEAAGATERVAAIGGLVAAQVDLDAVLPVAASAPPFPSAAADVEAATQAPRGEPDVRIGIARDRAFGFYYADDLDAMRAAGAALVPFDTLNDAGLPDVDALFIGGGFPESFTAELEANAALRRQIRGAIAAGMPAYAECGGLMYLARTLTQQGRRYEMVGAIPGDVVMHQRPEGRGYVVLEETAAFPWAAAGAATRTVRAHEFHYSSLENLPPDLRCAYAVRRGHGLDGARDGIVVGNLLASYAHLRSTGANRWAARFVAFVRERRAVRNPGCAPAVTTHPGYAAA